MVDLCFVLSSIFCNWQIFQCMNIKDCMQYYSSYLKGCTYYLHRVDTYAFSMHIEQSFFCVRYFNSANSADQPVSSCFDWCIIHAMFTHLLKEDTSDGLELKDTTIKGRVMHILAKSEEQKKYQYRYHKQGSTLLQWTIIEIKIKPSPTHSPTQPTNIIVPVVNFLSQNHGSCHKNKTHAV